ncbi:MAG: hypothetical protein IJ711_05205 [Lachnospiraceae bacterium]|nr:hypothetical protein [Lachnospiraceae bacterium]
MLRKWLKPPYNIDGWRFDVADVFARNDEIQLAHEIWPEIRRCIREENEQAYILAEDWGDCAGYLQGREWDSPMNYYGCARVIRQFAGLPDLFLERNEILRRVPYRMTAEDVKGRVMEHLAKLPFVIWQNQFNLIDSHDVSRMHNHKSVHPQIYRGAVILQFVLIGAPSIYYGDEVGIDGWTESTEGFRFPMPWSKDYESLDTYRLYRTLAHLKKEKAALCEGGFKFLYAQGETVVVARFDEDEALLAVVTVSKEDERIVLPIGSIGAVMPEDGRDVFGEKLDYTRIDDRNIKLKVEARKAYLIDCRVS